MQDETQAVESQAPLEDTASAQTSEAAEQLAQTAPEGTQVQGGESTEVTTEDTVEEKLYAGKYKSAEDLEKSYLELQSKATKDSQEKAELTKILNEAFTQPQDETGGYTAEQDENDPLAPEVSNLKRMVTVQGFIMAHPDADPAAMQKILTEDPLVNQINGYDARLQYAYAQSQILGNQQTIEDVKRTTAQQTEAKIVEKQAAQVETAKSAEPVDEGTELMTRATGNYSYGDRESARMAIIKKNLTRL